MSRARARAGGAAALPRCRAAAPSLVSLDLARQPRRPRASWRLGAAATKHLRHTRRRRRVALVRPACCCQPAAGARGAAAQLAAQRRRSPARRRQPAVLRRRGCHAARRGCCWSPPSAARALASALRRESSVGREWLLQPVSGAGEHWQARSGGRTLGAAAAGARRQEAGSFACSREREAAPHLYHEVPALGLWAGLSGCVRAPGTRSVCSSSPLPASSPPRVSASSLTSLSLQPTVSASRAIIAVSSRA